MDEAASSIVVLLVEDDARLAAMTKEFLESHGVLVTVAKDGRAGRDAAQNPVFDVVVLDLMLPFIDGLEVCRSLREKSDVPVIVATARREEADRIVGLELGADDYLTKPYSPRELLARIRALVRRARGELRASPRTLRVGKLVLDMRALTGTLDGRDLALTAYEFALLRVLAERRGRVLSREQLLELAKGSPDEAFDRSIDVRISRLRQKLGETPSEHGMLRTVRGAGYVLVERRNVEA